ncbi:Unknown protein sequence [Pseudomonas amygdali pv. lachrymans]|nr:Unknown protein sequence [Pseudomonas amygdali pv. lachrymans]
MPDETGDHPGLLLLTEVFILISLLLFVEVTRLGERVFVQGFRNPLYRLSALKQMEIH